MGTGSQVGGGGAAWVAGAEDKEGKDVPTTWHIRPRSRLVTMDSAVAMSLGVLGSNHGGSGGVPRLGLGSQNCPLPPTPVTGPGCFAAA
jgi:hypothetical protein